MTGRLQRTAWTAPREQRWWKRLPLTTGALAMAIQSAMSAAVLVSGDVWSLIPLAAIGFAGVSLNSRNALALGVPGILTLAGAAVAFGTGWASVPVLGLFGTGSWVVTYLAERAKASRREQFSEPVAVRNDLVVASSVVGVTAAITGVVFALTLLPKIPLVVTIPIAMLVASAMMVALGVSVRRTRQNVAGNEEYFRVGTAIESISESTPGQVNVNADVDLSPLLRSNKKRPSESEDTAS